MKRLLRLLLYLGSIACLFACNQNELDSLQEQINALKSDQLATINAQVSSINLSIQMLQSTDTDLKSYIQTLQEQLPALQEADAELDKRIDALKTALKDDVSAAKAEVLAELGAYKTSVNNQIKSLNEAIAYLQEKDAALEDEIDSLKEYVDKQLAATKDWAAATFATLVQFNELSEDVAGIKVSVTSLQDDLKKTNEDLAKAAEDLKASIASLDASIQQQITDLTTNFNDALSSATDKITAEYQAAIGKAIQDSEASIKKWINEQLTGYYTIAETDEKLDALQKTLEGQLNTQKAYLEDLISSLSTTLTQKIAENRTLIDELSTNADTQSQLISANAASISSNAEAILQNAGNISKNAGDIETCNQLIAANLSLIEQNQTAIETNAGRLKDLDGQVSSNVTAIAKNAENIAQNAALISTNATAISNNAAAITQNASDILQLRNSLTATKKEITDAYTEAISKAISQLDGKLSSQMTSEINTAVSNLESRINEKIAGLTKRVSDIEDDIKGIHTQISEILADIASIHESITDLLNRIQSITVIPTVSDGSVAINRNYNDFNFEVYPLSVAQKLPELALSCFSMRAAQTIQTKSDISFTDMPVSKVSYADGILTVTASAADFDLDFFAGEHGESARLLITYDNISISSGYFSLSPITAIPVSSISLNMTELFLTEGETESLIVTVKPDNATDKTVTWTSSKESVATVDQNGKVEAVGVGIATITAKAGELTANCDVKVSDSSGVGNIPNNEIWYTTTDGKAITRPFYDESFGASFVSNVYENGQGIIKFDGPVTSIPFAAFLVPDGWTGNDTTGEECYGLRYVSKIALPNSVKTIKNEAFAGLESLEELSLPEGIETIEGSAIVACKKLNNIVIPSTVSSIGANFAGCTSLTSLKVAASNPIYDSRNNCNAVIETKNNTLIAGCEATIIPESVKAIGGWAFWGRAFSSIVIPSWVTEIGYYAVGDCTSLTSITVLCSNPPRGDQYMFNASTCPIFVPAGSVDAYKTAPYWSNDADRITAIPEAIDLGLSIKWASFNLGASAPEEKGDLFAWGEVVPKTEFSLNNYVFYSGYSGGHALFSKYVTKSGYGTYDGRATLMSKDDAACQLWGNDWRLPTKEEQDELRTSCSWEYTQINEIPGWKVTSKINNNWIFLPDNLFINGATRGQYWSSSLYNTNASAYLLDLMHEGGDADVYWSTCIRQNGIGIRPVSE